MKTLLKVTHSMTLHVVLFSIFSVTLFAQDGPTRYYAFDYMKVAPGMHEDYLALEKAWKKIHKANVAAGKYMSWHLSSIISPMGAQAEYNYFTRTSFEGEKQLAGYLEDFSMPANFETLLTSEEKALVERTDEIRTFVKSEIWAREDVTVADDMSDGKIQVVNYFDFPEGKSRADHMQMEKEIWKPVHEARVKDGSMKGWVLLRKVMPGGSSMEYHDITIDIFTGIEQMMAPFFDNYFAKVHPGKHVDNLMWKTRNASNLVKREVRMSLDSTNN